MTEKKCIDCGSRLFISYMGIDFGTILHCPDEECLRFGLITTVWVEEDNETNEPQTSGKGAMGDKKD